MVIETARPGYFTQMDRRTSGETSTFERWAAAFGVWWPRHRIAFFALGGCVTVADVFLGDGWNTFAPMLAWGMFVGLHYILAQSFAMDDEKAERRTEDLRLRAYDQGHIDDIGGRHDVIIDAHHHLWDLERNYYPWLCDEPPVEGRHGDYRAIRQSYLTGDFRRDWDGLRVVGSVHIEAKWDPDRPGRGDGVGGVGRRRDGLSHRHRRPGVARPGGRGRCAGYAQAGFARVRGVRERPAVAAHPSDVVPYAPGSMSDPEWQRGYALLEARGLSFDLQAPFWHLPEARALAERFPGTTIIL